MKNLPALTFVAASLGLAFSAHAVQSINTNIGLVVKPTTTTTLVVKPTIDSASKAQAAAVTGPKVKPMATTTTAAPAKTGR